MGLNGHDDSLTKSDHLKSFRDAFSSWLLSDRSSTTCIVTDLSFYGQITIKDLMHSVAYSRNQRDIIQDNINEILFLRKIFGFVKVKDILLAGDISEFSPGSLED